MKAKVKDTGEVVDVKFSIHPNPDVEDTYWWCKDKEESYHKRELEFVEDTIDWEQRRYELAKIAMNSILTAPNLELIDNNLSAEDIAIFSATLADALIIKLKE